jgi:hypothetical protein
VRIDATHRKWAIGTAIVFAAITLAYIPYAWLSRKGPSGGSWPGLAYGIAGYAMMIFAALLSIRKKFPIWRIGRAQGWMRGHLWLGFLSYPFILYHAAFSFSGGTLASIMMVTFTIVFVSGIIGAILQHYMPAMILRNVPYETIYDQMDNVLAQLYREANALVEKVDVLVTDNSLLDASTERFIDVQLAPAITAEMLKPLKTMYAEKIIPYLTARGGHGTDLQNKETTKLMFAQLRKMLPEEAHPVVRELEDICYEKRDLDRQSLLHRVLHGWLLVHVPLSWAVLLMGGVHAVNALRY